MITDDVICILEKQVMRLKGSPPFNSDTYTKQLRIDDTAEDLRGLIDALKVADDYAIQAQRIGAGGRMS